MSIPAISKTKSFKPTGVWNGKNIAQEHIFLVLYTHTQFAASSRFVSSGTEKACFLEEVQALPKAFLHWSQLLSGNSSYFLADGKCSLSQSRDVYTTLHESRLRVQAY